MNTNPAAPSFILWNGRMYAWMGGKLIDCTARDDEQAKQMAKAPA
jgi:hypothetical protein